MGASMIRHGEDSRVRKPAERGFSLIEVVVSMVVLTVGMVSLLGVFGLAMASTQTSQKDMIAKQLANEAYESIVTARNSTQLSWSQIQNAASCSGSDPTSGGIFLPSTSANPTFYPIYNSGADGIYGTCDDTGAGEQTLQDPGPDGIFQTADDTFIPLTGYQRSIVFSPVYDSAGNVVPSLQNVTIIVQYSTPQQQQRTYTLNSYISQFN
ncbi:MAG: prepilin-type N-terminal cleavage/methylation domain-containing protein [Terriglobales bacterium]